MPPVIDSTSIGSRQFTLRALLLAVTAIAALTAALVVPLRRASRESREATNSSKCLSHLAMIRQALMNYHDVYGAFPPAVTRAPDGKPMHSWRALILPFLDEPLSEHYHVDEPWDGPRNILLAAMRPHAYACPSDAASAVGGATNFVAVLGPDMVFSGSRTSRLADFAAPSRAILIVEAADTGINWLEPRDLDYDTMDFGVGTPSGRNISSYHKRGPHVLLLDGTRHTLSPATNRRELFGLLVGGDGSEITAEALTGVLDSER